jgi:hypothetical protein
MPEPDDSFGERLYISEMQLTKAHLAADVNLNDVADALSEWTWLLGEEWSALLVSAVGDVFLSSRAHAICRLDTGTAELETVAQTLEDFEAALADPETIADWFLEPVVDELRLQGKQLESGQCYGFTILPIFEGGSYTSENRFRVSAAEHIRFTGEMHLQMRDVPDGGRLKVQLRE